MGYTTKLLLLILCIDFMLYLVGFTNGFGVVIEQGWTSQAGMTIMTAAVVAGIIGAVVGGIVPNLISGSYSVVYTIPAGFITGFLGAFLLQPMSFMVEPAMPVELKWLLMVFLNIMFVGAILNFIRGTD